jgi:hypothetical protein
LWIIGGGAETKIPSYGGKIDLQRVRGWASLAVLRWSQNSHLTILHGFAEIHSILQLSKAGDVTTLRLPFAFLKVGERYRDISPLC